MIALRQKVRMNSSIVLLLLLGLTSILIGGERAATVLVIRPAQAASPDLVEGNIPVNTYRYNNQRTGANTHELKLTVKNVNASHFGRLLTYPVDGPIYAQPLYEPGVRVGNRRLNLVIVATMNDSMYAFNADQAPGTGLLPIWHRSFLSGGARSVTTTDVKCTDMYPQIGVTSTPGIDPVTGTIYAVSFSQSGGNLFYFLHALDLSTGKEKAGSPTEIKGMGSQFMNKTERQRAALLLANGRIYMSFASFCDVRPFHGWLLAYGYDGKKFSRVAAYNTTAHGSDGGIWGSGGALAADGQGLIYTITGNGTFDLDKGDVDAGDSFLKLDATLNLLDYFTPFNQQCMDVSDKDLGSGGPVLLPGSGHELIGGGKEGRVYVLDTRHLGHFSAVKDPCTKEHSAVTTYDQVLQETAPDSVKDIFSTPAYWRGPAHEYVFISGTRDKTKAFVFANGKLSGPVSTTTAPFNLSAQPIVSSDGQKAGTGIVWMLDIGGFLHAYDATDLSQELYSSAIGKHVKFTSPVITNGKVFVPTANALEIYGLLQP